MDNKLNEFGKFYFAIARIYTCWHRISSEVMEGYGLKGSSAVYFAALYHCKDGITVSKLGEVCSRNKSDVSRIISQLEDLGHVRRECCGDNFYRAKLFLTDSGVKIAEQVDATSRKVADIASKGLNAEESAAFYKTLATVASNICDAVNDGSSVM